LLNLWCENYKDIGKVIAELSSGDGLACMQIFFLEELRQVE